MSERDENVDIDGTDGWGPITEGAMHPVAICAATIATLTAERDALTQRVAELETYKATAEELANSRVVMFRQFQSQIDAAIAEAGRLREALEIQGKWASSCGNNGDLPSFDELDEFRRDMDKVDTLTKATAPPAASDDDGLSHGVCPQCLNDGRNGEPLGRVTFEQDGATIEYRTCDECGWNGPEIVRPKPHAAGD